MTQPQSEATKGRAARDRAGAESEGMRGQVLFRQLNEEIRSLAGGFGLDAELDLVCECTNGGCFERLIVSTEDYEAIRRFPTRFLVKPRHDAGQVERIVEETAHFLVVERIGADAEAAIHLDPRRRGRRRELVERPLVRLEVT